MLEKQALQETFISESSLINNFEKLFDGYRCDFLAKIIYLYLSNQNLIKMNGKDCKLINFIGFIQAFLPLLVSITFS